MSDQAPAHSPIGASGYYRWKNCPGSVRLAKMVTTALSSIYADEGTEAHDLACQILQARAKGNADPDLLGYDPDMLDHVMVYVDHMISIQRPGCIQLYEHRFHLKKVHPLCYGTADGVTYYPDEMLLVISDLKYGAGVYVDVERNDQLLYYATGAVLSLGWHVKRVRIEIIQPRINYAEAIRPWECDIFDIMDFEDELRANALATEDPNAPLCAGDWCQFCPAAAVCPLLQLKAKVMMARDVLSIEEVAADLQWLPVLEAMANRKREFAYTHAEKGGVVPGYKLVKKEGRRQWRDGDDAGDELVLAGLRPHQIHHPVEPPPMLSPAQIEALPVKEIPFPSKAALKEFVKSLTTTKSSGHKLVPVDHPGDAIVVPTAKSVFTAHRKEIAELT